LKLNDVYQPITKLEVDKMVTEIPVFYLTLKVYILLHLLHEYANWWF